MRHVERIWLAPLLFAAWASVACADGPAPLARYFPAEDLVAYVEFDGIDAHAEAWKRTAASKILNETPTGAMLETVFRQLADPIRLLFEEGEDEKDNIKFPSYDDASAIARHMVRSGFAFAINRKPGDPKAKPSCIGLVLRNGARGPIESVVKQFMKMSGVDEAVIATKDATGGRKFRLFGGMEGPCVAWWSEGDDLAFAIMEGRYVETMISALDGKIPNAVDHPLRKELLTPSGGFEPVGLAFLDARALPPLPPEAVLFGLDGINRVDVRWGYRGEALESVTRVAAPAPRKGILALFDQPTFDSKTLPPRPAGAGSFAAASLDLGAAFDKLRSFTSQFDPTAGPAFDEFARMFEAQTGKKLRESIFARIGPKLLLADVPTRMVVPTAPFDAMARGMARVPRLSLLVEIKDRPRLIEDLDALAKWANEQFPLPKGREGKPAPSLVRRLKGTELGYEIALSPTYWPLPAGYRPSIVIGDQYLSLGTTPDVARQALRSGAEAEGPMTRALAGMPDDLTLLSVTDTPNSALPELLANVPSVIQWWAFMIQGFAMNSGISVSSVPSPANVPGPLEPIPPAAIPQKLEAKPDESVRPATASVPPSIPGATPAQRPAAETPAVTPAPSAPPAPVAAAPTPPVAFAPPVEATPAVTVVPGTPAPAPAPAPAAAPATAPGPVVLASPSSPAIAGPRVQAPAPANMLVRLRLDPDEIPDPEQIRPLLFPAAYALSVDAQGFRFTSREAFPAWNPTGLAPLAIAFALPSMQQRTVQVDQEQQTSKLNQINEAIRKYQEKNGVSVPRAKLGPDEKPMLSWRVELLPFLGEQALYDEFRRDEPWDSPANQKLIARIPAVYVHPTLKTEPGMTFVRGISDPESKNRIGQATFLDESVGQPGLGDLGKPVPWTKPEVDLSLQLDPGLGQRPSPLTNISR